MTENPEYQKVMSQHSLKGKHGNFNEISNTYACESWRHTREPKGPAYNRFVGRLPIPEPKRGIPITRQKEMVQAQQDQVSQLVSVN